MKRNLVTVIIAAFNMEKYLEICIESILCQSYKELEIIIVDDGSTDMTGEICDDFDEKDSRVKVIHKENGGLSDARNSALDVTQGEFVSFIDADDFIHPQMIEHLLSFIDSDEISIVSCGYEAVYEDDQNINGIDYTTYKSANDFLDKLKYEELKDVSGTYYSSEDSLYNIYNDKYLDTILLCNKLFRIELFSNRRFDIKMVREDERIIPYLLYYSKGIVYTEDKLYFYLQRHDSFMHEKLNIKQLDVLLAFEERIEFFRKNNLKELSKLAIYTYFTQIIYFYRRFVNDKDEKMISDMRNQYKKMYKQLVGKTDLSVKQQIVLFSFYTSPMMHKFLMGCIKAVRRN